MVSSVIDNADSGGWLDSVKACWMSSCAADSKKRISSDDERPYLEKQNRVFYDQPGLTPPPYAPLQHQSGTTRSPYGKRTSETKDRMGLFNMRTFSVRRRLGLRENEPPRRPQISGPTNFVHLTAQSFQYPRSSLELPFQPRQRKRDSFRGLRLTIHEPENMLSPLLPHIIDDDSDISPPPAARLRADSGDDSTTLVHSRSYSSMSFHLPRRPPPEEPSFSTTTTDIPEEHGPPPAIPPRARTRPRAYTSPSVEAIVERIASAIIERDILQNEIDNVVERQSIYISSRPSTAYCTHEAEYMSSIPVPALPPHDAPSFAERVSVEERPRTAPSKLTKANPNRAMRSGSARSTPPRKSSPDFGRYEYASETPLAPPLPLVLRPPLRKKKSFSRVSSWLFPAANEVEHPHRRDISLDSVTNAPRAVTERDGFYQCMQPAAEIVRRASSDTVSSQSTWTTEEEQTAPTTWSPESTPAPKQEKTLPLGRFGTFGRNSGPRPTSVGVAF